MESRRRSPFRGLRREIRLPIIRMELTRGPWTLDQVVFDSPARFGSEGVVAEGSEDIRTAIRSVSMQLDDAWAVGMWLLTADEITNEEVAVFKVKGIVAFTAFTLALFGCPWDAGDVNDLPDDDPKEEIEISRFDEAKDPDTSNHLRRIATDGQGTWIAASREDQGVSRSTDNGETWNLIPNILSGIGITLATDGNGTWVLVGRDDYGHRSTDDGATWSSMSLPVPSDTFVLGAVWGPGNEIIAAGSDNTSSGNALIIRSTDGGASWEDLDAPGSDALHGPVTTR